MCQRRHSEGSSFQFHEKAFPRIARGSVFSQRKTAVSTGALNSALAPDLRQEVGFVDDILEVNAA